MAQRRNFTALDSGSQTLLKDHITVILIKKDTDGQKQSKTSSLAALVCHGRHDDVDCLNKSNRERARACPFVKYNGSCFCFGGIG